MQKKINVRSRSAQILEKVIENRQSLKDILQKLGKEISGKDKALIQEFCFGILRTLAQMEWFINKLMYRPLTGRNRTVHYLIIVGLYQLIYTRIPPYAILNETVEGVVFINRPKLKNLINGILRHFQSHLKQMTIEFSASNHRYLHPRWLLKRLKRTYPKKWKLIINANNKQPPMWLRVNRNYLTRDEWIDLLKKKTGIEGFIHPDYPDAVCVSVPISVQSLPGFEYGWVTVQDVSAQDCMNYLNPMNGEHILDLCAAPGGKTTHILEIAPQARVTAVDININRIPFIYENLKRMKMKAEVKQGDGRTPEIWCGKEKFDKILLDVPCSSTGVIRRHPDIKWIRRDRDIKKLSKLQKEMLDAIWPYLKHGGILVYSTCSILPEENSLQINHFLRRTPNADLTLIGSSQKLGKQHLPGVKEGDGFFYAKITKI